MTVTSVTFKKHRVGTGILTKCSLLPSPAPFHKLLILSNEAGLRLKNPAWPMVENAIRGMNPGRGNSFCALENPDRGFVQALCGFNGYHLEWHEGQTGDPGSYQHLRGAYPGGSTKSIELKKHDRMSRGEYRDLLPLEEVIETFLAFYRSAEKPGWLTWRLIEI